MADMIFLVEVRVDTNGVAPLAAASKCNEAIREAKTLMKAEGIYWHVALSEYKNGIARYRVKLGYKEYRGYYYYSSERTPASWNDRPDAIIEYAPCR